jgi:hypothetical protein
MNDNLQMIISKMMSQFGKYASTDEAISYYQEAAGTMGDAEIFQSENGKDVYESLIEEALLRQGANPSQVSIDEMSRKGAAGSERALFTKATVALMQVPKIAGLSQDEYAALPEQMKALYNQYQALVDVIHQKIAAMRQASSK